MFGGPWGGAPRRRPDEEGGRVEYEELAAFVRDAAAGLDERDRLVLELGMRQGLQGADLAEALGVSASQSYSLVHACVIEPNHPWAPSWWPA